MRTCRDCGHKGPDKDFKKYKKKDKTISYRNQCIPCYSKIRSKKANEWKRKKRKETPSVSLREKGLEFYQQLGPQKHSNKVMAALFADALRVAFPSHSWQVALDEKKGGLFIYASENGPMPLEAWNFLGETFGVIIYPGNRRYYVFSNEIKEFYDKLRGLSNET